MKILLMILSIIMRKRGYSAYFAPRIVKGRLDDIFKNNNTTMKQKVWAQRRGFLSDKIAFYGLTEHNYTNYLSDFDYYKLHPINDVSSKWIDDKLTIKYVLFPFSRYLPDYYYQINKDGIIRLMDCPDEFGTTIQDIMNLLKSKENLAAKLISGSFAEGFYKLSYIDSNYYVNDKIVKKSEVETLFNDWKNIKTGGYVLTEYLRANSQLSKIWGNTPNTLRIMTIHENNEKPRLASSFMRFGTKKTGVIDNATAGGVACKVDVETGYFSEGRTIEGGKMVESRYHPDTNALMEGILPYWDSIKEKIIEICEYIPQVKYMGFDVIITDNGFKIIEINSHQGIKIHQHYCPIYKNEYCKGFFRRLIEEKVN